MHDQTTHIISERWASRSKCAIQAANQTQHKTLFFTLLLVVITTVEGLMRFLDRQQTGGPAIRDWSVANYSIESGGTVR